MSVGGSNMKREFFSETPRTFRAQQGHIIFFGFIQAPSADFMACIYTLFDAPENSNKMRNLASQVRTAPTLLKKAINARVCNAQAAFGSSTPSCELFILLGLCSEPSYFFLSCIFLSFFCIFVLFMSWFWSLLDFLKAW